MKKLPIIFVGIILVGIIVLILSTKTNKQNPNVISGSGTIEVEEIEIGSKLAGRVERISADEGQIIDSGQVLIELDHKELDAQLSQAQASLKVASTQINQAKSNLENLERNLRRIEELYKNGAATQQQMDDLKTKLDVAEEQYKLNSHLFEQAQATADLVKAQLENAIIKSPIKGTVIKKNAELGEIVFPGASLLTLADLSWVWLKIYVNETKLGLVKLGQKARVKVDSYPNKDFEGEVIHISDQAEFTPKNIQTKEERVKLVFAVKIKSDNPLSELKPGMPADAEIEVK
jgi:HlyD family secretion protein